MIRRSLALLLAAAMMVSLPPLGQTPSAAAGRKRVVRCGAGCWPTAFAFTPDGAEIFYVERFSGEIRRAAVDGQADRRWARIGGVSGEGEQGMLGIALDPDWEMGPEHQWVYVFYTDQHPLRNRIVRLRKRPGGKGIQRDQLASLAARGFHNAGVIHFGPDGKLYAVTGDAGVPSRSQNAANLSGKVLRLEPGGGRPADNPIAGSKAYSTGHRNSFGFAFDPTTGTLWQSENGPECDDEINRVLPGENYGWGGASDCPDTSESGPSPEQPKLRFNPVVALTGAAFCAGCGLAPDVDGDLLVGSYLGGRIYHLSLNGSRDSITGQSVLYDHPSSVLAVEAAPDGRMYFSDRSGIFRLR